MRELDLLYKYVSMNKNNPIFIRDRGKAVQLLTSLRNRGEIDSETYNEFLDRISLKYGQMRLLLEKSFKWFIEITNIGWEGMYFTEESLLSLLTARKVSGEFYSWVEESRHRPNNPYLLDYFKELSKNLVEAYNNPNASDDIWEDFLNLKYGILMALGRGLVTRDKIQTFVKIAYLYLIKEQELLEQPSLFSDNLDQMTSFGGNRLPMLEGYSRPKVAGELFLLFSTNTAEFKKRSDYWKEFLLSKKASGELSQQDYLKFRDHLESYSKYIISGWDSPVYEPIVTYYVCQKTSEYGPMLLFNTQQILRAMDLAKDMYQNLTNGFLVQELLQKRLSERIEEFGAVSAAKKSIKAQYEYYLEMLREFSVISIQEYKEFERLGRLKFDE